MFKAVLHRIVANPWVYDRVQDFFGVQRKKKLVHDRITLDQEPRTVLDVGGGTGLYLDLWPSTYRYICLDNDMVKLQGYAAKNPRGAMLCADAGRIPLKSGSVDFVYCSSMSHHVPTDVVEALISESARILKSNGKLIFMDAVLRQESFLNRFLWKIDRGEFPHTEDVLRGIFERHCRTDVYERFSIYYDYVLMIGSPK